MTPSIYIGQYWDSLLSTGVVSQLGGSVTASTQIVLGNGNRAKGLYTLGGGTLTTPTLSVGVALNSESAFVQTGGVCTITSQLILGNGANCTSSYVLGGGTLTVPSLTLAYYTNVNVSFVQTGGVLNATSINLGYGAGSNAYLCHSGGVAFIKDLAIGCVSYTTSRWDIAGGDITVTNLYTAYGSGNVGGLYDIRQSGGLLNVTNFSMGWNGACQSTFTQSGGTNKVSTYFVIGRNSGGSHTYVISGGKLITPLLSVGTPLIELSGSTGALHVVGMAPEIQCSSLTMAPPARGSSTLKLTLGSNGGMRPIAVSGTATLNGTLTIGRADNRTFFEPGGVVTVMTCGARSGAFAQTNFLDGVSCQVNYYANRVTLENLRPLTAGTMIIVR